MFRSVQKSISKKKGEGVGWREMQGRWSKTAEAGEEIQGDIMHVGDCTFGGLLSSGLMTALSSGRWLMEPGCAEISGLTSGGRDSNMATGEHGHAGKLCRTCVGLHLKFLPNRCKLLGTQGDHKPGLHGSPHSE